MEESADGHKIGFVAQLAIMVAHSLRRREEYLWFSRDRRTRIDQWMEFWLCYISLGSLVLKLFAVYLSLITLLTVRSKRAENEIRLNGKGIVKRTCEGSTPPPLGIDFPFEIMLNIFSRIPVESVLKCRQVCNTWRNLLRFDDNYFAAMHLRCHLGLLQQQLLYHDNSPYDNHIYSKVSFLYLGRYRSFYYVEYDENDKQSYKKFTRINLKLPTDTAMMVGSCNGLVCLAVRRENCVCVYDPIYICNPITREFVSLPKLVVKNEHKEDRIRILQEFGYSPSTNEYKVVRIYSLYNQPSVGWVYVYTLGSGSGWRDVGEINNVPCTTSRHILVNGYLHWLDLRGGKIMAFNLANEKFCMLPSPPCLIPDPLVTMNFGLRVLGGRLCFVHQTTFLKADIWSLKRIECISSYAVMKEHEYQSWSWSKIFTLENMYEINRKKVPFAFTSSGEILLCDNREKIVCYDPKSATANVIGILHDDLLRSRDPISHLNSFISLKALGENTTILGTLDGLDD